MTGDTDDAGVGQVPTEGRPIFRRLYLTWNEQKLSLSGDLNEFVRRMGRLSEIPQSGDLYDRAYVDRLVLWHLGSDWMICAWISRIRLCPPILRVSPDARLEYSRLSGYRGMSVLHIAYRFIISGRATFKPTK